MMISNKVDFYFHLYVFFKEKNNFMEQPSFWNRISIAFYFSFYSKFFHKEKKNERYIGTHERILKVINKYPVFFSKYFKTWNTKFHKTSRLPCTSSERSHPIMVTSSNWSSTSTFFTFFHLLADSRGTWTSRYDSLRRWSVLDLRPPFLTS